MTEELVWCTDLDEWVLPDEVTETADGQFIYDVDKCPIYTVDTDRYYWDSLCFDGHYAWDTNEAYEYPDKAVEDGVLWKDALTAKYYTTENTPYVEVRGEKFSIKSAEKVMERLFQNLETAQEALNRIEIKLDKANGKLDRKLNYINPLWQD